MASLAELQAEFNRRQGEQQPTQPQPAPSELQALEAEFARRQEIKPDQGVQDDSIGRIDSDGGDNGDSGVEKTAANVDKALLSIPGVPSLAEFAAGTNRSVAGFLDFLGPDNVNAIFELSGSESRVPTFSEQAAPAGSFVEPGLQQKILSTAGEIAPAALGIGQTLRTLASKLPAIAGETAAKGTLRQLGQSTAKQDIVGGAAAGAGQEVGREVGGETGALIGSIAAPLAVAAIPLSSAKSAAAKLLKKSAPSSEQLKDSARAIYKSIDDSGLVIPAKEFDTLSDDIVSTMRKEGFDEDLTPQIKAIIRRFGEGKGQDKGLGEIDLLRQIARDAGDSVKRSERRLSEITVNKIDDFLDSQTGQVGDKEVGQAFKSARDLWQRVRKVETLETAITNAKNQASGFENGVRTQFRQILKRIDSGKLKGYTDEEKTSIRKVVQGTKAGNVARFLGKFGVLDGVTSRSLTTLGGAGLAGSAGGAPAAIAVPAIGQISGALAQRMTAKNAAMASAIIKAGKKSNVITRIYIKNTPKAQRSSTELAELLIANKVPVTNINLKSAPPLLSSAALIASIAQLNDKEESN